MSEQEVKVVEKLKAKIDKMLEASPKKLFNNCENAHLSEIVKLCHQVRSLEGGK